MSPESTSSQKPSDRGDPPGVLSTLRFQLLTGLGLLLGAFVAVAGAAAVWMPQGPSLQEVLVGLGGLVVVDVAVLLLFGDHMLRSLVVRPVRRMARRARRIADGEHEVRLELRGSAEMRRLAGSVNRMADRLIENQRALRENVRSLDEANRALMEAKNEVVRAEKMATVGRLAAGVAPEVGNPLNAVMGYLEVARRQGPDEEVEWIEGIEHEARRTVSLVLEDEGYEVLTASGGRSTGCAGRWTRSAATPTSWPVAR